MLNHSTHAPKQRTGHAEKHEMFSYLSKNVSLEVFHDIRGQYAPAFFCVKGGRPVICLRDDFTAQDLAGSFTKFVGRITVLSKCYADAVRWYRDAVAHGTLPPGKTA